MPTEHIVALLIEERDKLNRAIEALQGHTKRRGRPAKNRLAAEVPTAVEPPKARRKGMSNAARKAQSKRMKAYWAAKRKKKR